MPSAFRHAFHSLRAHRSPSAASSAWAAWDVDGSATHVDVLGHRGSRVAELVGDSRADSAASSRMVAAVFRKVCDVIHASVPAPRASRSVRRTLAGSRKPPRTRGTAAGPAARRSCSDAAAPRLHWPAVASPLPAAALGPLPQQALPLDADQRAADLDRPGVEVHLGPHRASASPIRTPGREHEEHQVRQVSASRGVVGTDLGEQPAALRETTRGARAGRASRAAPPAPG